MAEHHRRRSLGSGPYRAGSQSSQDELPRASHEFMPPLYENSLMGGFVGPFQGHEVSQGYGSISPDAGLMSWVTGSRTGSLRCAAASASSSILIFSKRDPEYSPEYSKYPYLRWNHWPLPPAGHRWAIVPRYMP